MPFNADSHFDADLGFQSSSYPGCQCSGLTYALTSLTARRRQSPRRRTQVLTILITEVKEVRPMILAMTIIEVRSASAIRLQLG